VQPARARQATTNLAPNHREENCLAWPWAAAGCSPASCLASYPHWPMSISISRLPSPLLVNNTKSSIEMKIFFTYITTAGQPFPKSSLIRKRLGSVGSPSKNFINSHRIICSDALHQFIPRQLSLRSSLFGQGRLVCHAVQHQTMTRMALG
jgi:hypothetical protein